MEFGQAYECKNDYIILGESVPSGTTTATATALALGYDCESKFSSSFKDVPNDVRRDTIEKALLNVTKDDDLFSILGKTVIYFCIERKTLSAQQTRFTIPFREIDLTLVKKTGANTLYKLIQSF